MVRPVVLVTGATGYIAMHIVQQLLDTGEYQVRGTIRDLKHKAKVDALKALAPPGKTDNQLDLFEADLLQGGRPWERAVKGCTYVIHTASPFPIEEPKNDTEIVTLAVTGTKNVLEACREVEGIKRVVLTSSIVAVAGSIGADDGSKLYTERDWPESADSLGGYAKSKMLAEREAWSFVQALPAEKRFELTVINPSYVMGPVLSGEVSSGSMLLPKRLLEHQVPMLPHLNFPIVDVRDVATAHIRAMTARQAAGERHLVHAANIWMEDMAKILAIEFGPHGYKVPAKKAPYAMLWLISICDASLRSVIGLIGKQTTPDNTRMRQVLGIEPRDINGTLIDMCYSLIEKGLVKKTSQYTGR